MSFLFEEEIASFSTNQTLNKDISFNDAFDFQNNKDFLDFNNN